MDRKKLGKNSRRKGHNAELYYMNIFKEIGFCDCMTSRQGSRLHDNAKIDLINLPFNVQIKAGSQKTMNVGKEMLAMDTAIKSLFQEDSSTFKKPRFLIHKKSIGRGKKATEEHEVVYMSYLQFQKYGIPNYIFKKLFVKIEADSEYRDIVGITFKVFKEEIINKHFINGINNNSKRGD